MCLDFSDNSKGGFAVVSNGTISFLNGLTTGLDKHKFQRKIVNIFLPINFNICLGSSKEPSH